MEHEKIDIGGVRDKVQDLIATLRDSQNGHRFGAEHVKDAELKRLFEQVSLKRGQFAGELEAEVQRLGEHDPKREGTVKGSMHRAWLELKSKLGAGDDAGVLAWMEQGEDYIKHQYEDILKEKLPADLVAILDRQAQEIISVHDQVKQLRDRFKNAA